MTAFRNKNTHRPVYLWVVALSMLVISCAGLKPSATPSPRFPFKDPELFKNRPHIVSEEQIHRLSPAREKEFLTFFNAPSRQDIPAHKRLYQYLNKITENITYDNGTYTAEQTLDLKRGNCLSLAILTTALARLANVEIGYQLMDSAPVYQLQDTVVFKGLHVSSMLFDSYWSNDSAENDSGNNKKSVYLWRPGIRIDYFPISRERFVRNISYRDYLAMYYRNLAAEAIAQENYTNAYWYALTSMDYEPESSHAFNIMAVIYNRMGDTAKAEAIYKYGIEELDDTYKLTLLKNYRLLLNEHQRYAEAETITRKIEQLDDPSPFSWLSAARTSYSEGNFREAISFYKKTINIAPYLHEAYLGLAQSYYQVGRLKSAEKNLQLALEKAYKESTKTLYQAKLRALARELQ